MSQQEMLVYAPVCNGELHPMRIENVPTSAVWISHGEDEDPDGVEMLCAITARRFLLAAIELGWVTKKAVDTGVAIVTVNRDYFFPLYVGDIQVETRGDQYIFRPTNRALARGSQIIEHCQILRDTLFEQRLDAGLNERMFSYLEVVPGTAEDDGYMGTVHYSFSPDVWVRAGCAPDIDGNQANRILLDLIANKTPYKIAALKLVFHP